MKINRCFYLLLKLIRSLYLLPTYLVIYLKYFLGAIDSHRSSCNNVQQLLDHHPDTGQDADISDLSEPQYANVGPNAGNR